MAVKSGWPMTRVLNKKGTTVYASSCRVYKVSEKFNMYTSRCVFIYNNTHDYISVRRVCKHHPLPDDIPWVSTSMCE